MRAIVIMLAAVAVAAIAGGAAAQQAARPVATPGPVIEKYGPVFDVPDADLTADRSATYKVVFEVKDTPDDTSALNPAIVTLARFLNMQARAGVPLERLQLALVVHGPAIKDVLGHAAYRARHAVDNPNLDLLAALGRAGVRVYLCGQSAGARGVARDELAPDVRMALSAITAILHLEAEGYRLLQ